MNINQKATEFSLFDKDNKKHSLSDVKSDYIIVYFYPKDNTEGCTIEAIDFTKYLNDFKKLKTEIIGISGGDNNTKKQFCEKNNLKVTLLSDPEFTISKKYGVYGEKNFMGKKYLGIKRTTFILDKSKKTIKVYENIKAEGHAKEVLDFISDFKKNII